jgi:hypothetical protein
MKYAFIMIILGSILTPVIVNATDVSVPQPLPP